VATKELGIISDAQLRLKEGVREDLETATQVLTDLTLESSCWSYSIQASGTAETTCSKFLALKKGPRTSEAYSHLAKKQEENQSISQCRYEIQHDSTQTIEVAPASNCSTAAFLNNISQGGN
jgi:hypothetical protein